MNSRCLLLTCANDEQYILDRLVRDNHYHLIFGIRYSPHARCIRLGWMEVCTSSNGKIIKMLMIYRWLFLIEGLITLLIGLASFFRMPASAVETKKWFRPKGWFTDREVRIVVNRVLRDDPSKGKHPPLYILKCLKHASNIIKQETCTTAKLSPPVVSGTCSATMTSGQSTSWDLSSTPQWYQLPPT
jgi:hypothetical protein